MSGEEVCTTRFYLSSPGSQTHADHCAGMPVLVSYALYSPWVDSYVASFGRVLIDSGAYSEFTGKVKVDGAAYSDWCCRWRETAHVDAVAGLDDIRGDWRRSLRNYEAFGGFPTFHESDPEGLLDDLLPLARARGGWLGIGLIPPRGGKWEWVKRTLRRIPPGLHVHFWAGGEYVGHPRVDSADSTSWFKEAWDLKTNRLTSHLTPAECVDVVVKRYHRARRVPVDVSVTPDLFADVV